MIVRFSQKKCLNSLKTQNICLDLYDQYLWLMLLVAAKKTKPSAWFALGLKDSVSGSTVEI